jgi:hypothetical protein
VFFEEMILPLVQAADTARVLLLRYALPMLMSAATAAAAPAYAMHAATAAICALAPAPPARQPYP